MKFLLFFLIVFVSFALLIISNNNLSFLDDNNIRLFSEFYGNWSDQVFSNLRVISGNAVKMSWTP